MILKYMDTPLREYNFILPSEKALLLKEIICPPPPPHTHTHTPHPL